MTVTVQWMNRAAARPAPRLPDSLRPRPAPAGDRYQAFAFAAAELLVETDLDGTIRFAAGAFRQRFGRDGIAFIGRPVESLIAPGDQIAFALALASMPLRGRLAPMLLRTSDPAATGACVAAMPMPGAAARLCFTFATPPLSQAMTATPPDAIRFAGEAEAVLRAGAPAWLVLLESAGAAPDIPGTVTGMLAPGRHAVLCRAPFDTAGRACVLPLGAAEGGMPQATRALRLVLRHFTRGGLAACAGAEGGLPGILAQIARQSAPIGAMLDGGDFALSFQPVVALADRAVQHHEALLRPAGRYDADEFVTLAQALGLSARLDGAVLRRALAALDGAPDRAVAVNISGASLGDADFPGFLLDEVRRRRPGQAGMGRLLIELTASADIADIPAAAAVLAALRGAGVTVGLDDFGAGSGNFDLLRHFALDYVKIDGAAIRAAETSPRERGFVAGLIELAAGLGARVVGEMIETEAQCDMLRELGADMGQGWLFGRPEVLPA